MTQNWGAAKGNEFQESKSEKEKEPRCSLSDHRIRMWQKFSGMEFAKTTCKTYWVQVPKTEIRSHNQGPESTTPRRMQYAIYEYCPMAYAVTLRRTTMPVGSGTEVEYRCRINVREN